MEVDGFELQPLAELEAERLDDAADEGYLRDGEEETGGAAGVSVARRRGCACVRVAGRGGGSE